MFTGIITNLGSVESIDFNEKNDLLLKIATDKSNIKRKLEIGCSIACNGICLTLIGKEISRKKVIFSFQASQETCQRTTLKNWSKGQLINLEFALRIGDELGGHMVLGHVDGLAKITGVEPVKDSRKFTFETKNNLMKFIAEKGSIALDGVSLTVNSVNKNSFHINIIPHSLANTNFQNAKLGDEVNLEIDAMARYAARLLQNA